MSTVEVVLHDVHTIKACAELDTSNGISLQPVEGGEFTPEISFRFLAEKDAEYPATRMGVITVAGDTASGRFEVEVAGVFTMPDPGALPEPEKRMVVGHALNLLFPFVRAEIRDITARVLKASLVAPPMDFTQGDVTEVQD